MEQVVEKMCLDHSVEYNHFNCLTVCLFLRLKILAVNVKTKTFLPSISFTAVAVC